MDNQSFRQIHLDFHTAEQIPGVGSAFSKQQFQSMLRLSHASSVTLFSKCHHGWAYHPSTANETHPELRRDLLGEMMEAAHEIGVRTPVYLSAGLDEKMARRHPDWLIRDQDEKTTWVPDFVTPGYHRFCFNSPYLEYLLAQIEEVVRNYPCDGIFLDIVGVRNCYCQNCRRMLRGEGKDYRDTAVVRSLAEQTYAQYTRRVREVVHGIRPGLGIFHNGGHIQRGRRDLADMNTHLELESLPTGGWGYDHFPLSARYVQQLGMQVTGMTGKFHTAWGEFGGYKHPHALQYEAALSLAHGAGCSVGDQLHPDGLMDEASCRLIGAAFREVEAKEPWCRQVVSVADVGLLSLEAVVSAGGTAGRKAAAQSDAGAVRMLSEGKILFDVLDTLSDFSLYKVIVLPDMAEPDAVLEAKLRAYLASGGKILASGTSGRCTADGDFMPELGVRWLGSQSFCPDYFVPDFDIAGLGSPAFVMYSQGQRVECMEGTHVLGHRENPWFNREAETFCSHQHTPSDRRCAGAGMTRNACSVYLAWPVFSEYAVKGSLVAREMVLEGLNRLIPEKTLRVSLPAQGVTTLMKQPHHHRYVHHLLYASPVRRGEGIEVIEDILTLREIQAQVRVPETISAVKLEPQGVPLAFSQKDGVLDYEIPELKGHQMVILSYEKQEKDNA